jgi:DNA polymerase I-like protein with 3'-5' exonuclease and polymerase domains
VEYLSDPATDTKALKAKLKQQRQNAKPPNFGLLFGAQAETLWRLGVTDYALSWTLAEVTEVWALWLETYADVRFWQLWTQYVHVTSRSNTTQFLRRNRYSGEIEVKDYRIRTGRTLGGRPIYTPELREVLNHQDQSTGAEITTRAIVMMPARASQYLVNVVHDELLAVCLAEEADGMAEAIVQAFRAAMDAVLAPWGIPSGADASIG